MCTRGAGEVCQGFDHALLFLVLVRNEVELINTARKESFIQRNS